MDRVQRAIDVLRDAQRRAEALEREPIIDPTWGPWYRQADQRVIYEMACRRALEILEGGEADADR